MVNIDRFVQNEAPDTTAKSLANESRLAQKMWLEHYPSEAEHIVFTK